MTAAVNREAEVDPRLAHLSKSIVSADLTDEDQKTVSAIVIAAYDKLVLFPTKSSWRKDNKEDPDWSRKMLEREVERTQLQELCQVIKRELDSQLTPLWHVAYGRNLGVYVTSENFGFVHLTLEGADIIAWRHGK